MAPLQAELLATLEAIRWSIRHNFVSAYIFTDCYNAVVKIAGTSDFHYSDTFLLCNLEKEIFDLLFGRSRRFSAKILTLPPLGQGGSIGLYATSSYRGTTYSG
ncbi:hypothetical protein RHMOL_Rhmol05G0224100 [Rhododendron molle]|uniref:Uncharacterized protein n=1 Tax=Rhododendron molle TaxID=49168 RepID=A0ACC0NS86_RHOML|nr:hypothetical protein RHMOL_Rhmol05G0224100 [Rhododendron molle]